MLAISSSPLISTFQTGEVFGGNFLMILFAMIFNNIYVPFQLSWSKHLFGHLWVLSILKEEGETGRAGLLLVCGC